MNATLSARLEKALVLLLAASFAFPLALGTWLKVFQRKSVATAWFRNVTLRGLRTRPDSVALSRATVASARFQAAYAAGYDDDFAGRELCIRLINELYLRGFHTSPTGLVVGPALSLVEASYAKEYCLQRGSQDELRPFVDDLRRVQDFCDARGIAFALVITPSKAAVYPEGLPESWLHRRRPEPRYYDNLLPLLQEEGIRFVDGHRIAVEMKSSATVPVFPLGGVHWGDPAALATTNALLTLLAQEQLPVQPIECYKQTVSDRPTGQDRDLGDLANTLLSWRYPVATITVQPLAAEAVRTDRPNMVVVGGSFVWSMFKLLDDSRKFSEIEYYSYYKLAKYAGLDGEEHKVREPATPVDFEQEIFAADALVLEANEQTLHHPNHLNAFLQDALAVLPDPAAAKAPFLYESQMPYAWGNTLSFVSNQGNSVKLAATTGFGSLTQNGAYTIGKLATIRFHAQPPSRDVVLEVEAGAFLVDTRLPEQNVSVFANGRPVGSWRFTEVKASRHDLLIPKDILVGGEVTLEFHIAQPRSPAEFGISRNSRKLGMLVTSLQLREVN